MRKNYKILKKLWFRTKKNHTKPIHIIIFKSMTMPSPHLH